jgi:hypothetical protein
MSTPEAPRAPDPRGRFYLGVHDVSWLERTDAPLFLSHARLSRNGRKKMPRAIGRWALDSGGFSELSIRGKWTVTAPEYARAAESYALQIGGLDWAAIQDWMCEPFVLSKTGLSVKEHQARTVASLLELRALAPASSGVRWLPVLQGFSLAQYLECLEAYDKAGVDLRNEPVVGIGSVCRRQHTAEAEETIRRLVDEYALRLHGFGFKITGLRALGRVLTSSDSMAWSFDARRKLPMEGHDKPGPNRRSGHKCCNNCLDFALDWRDEVLRIIAGTDPLTIRPMYRVPTPTPD